ncbi:hypothetical protein GJ496_004478 [Pomphorhynchus laevis]|nr:hypothetical protein GJ496_004478 [Pomphorhynchus laevis]
MDQHYRSQGETEHLKGWAGHTGHILQETHDHHDCSKYLDPLRLVSLQLNSVEHRKFKAKGSLDNVRFKIPIGVLSFQDFTIEKYFSEYITIDDERTEVLVQIFKSFNTKLINFEQLKEGIIKFVGKTFFSTIDYDHMLEFKFPNSKLPECALDVSTGFNGEDMTELHVIEEKLQAMRINRERFEIVKPPPSFPIEELVRHLNDLGIDSEYLISYSTFAGLCALAERLVAIKTERKQYDIFEEYPVNKKLHDFLLSAVQIDKEDYRRIFDKIVNAPEGNAKREKSTQGKQRLKKRLAKPKVTLPKFQMFEKYYAVDMVLMAIRLFCDVIVGNFNITDDIIKERIWSDDMLTVNDHYNRILLSKQFELIKKTASPEVIELFNKIEHVFI